MIDFLTFVIVGLALLQPNAHRMAVAGIFAAFTFTHNMFMFTFEGLAYYGTDAIFYLIVILAIASLPKASSFAVSIQKICLAAVVLDYFGWLIWMLYIPPTIYNAAFMVLYAYTIMILLKGEREDVGDNPVDVGVASLRSHARTGHPINISHQKAI